MYKVQIIGIMLRAQTAQSLWYGLPAKRVWMR